MKRKVITIGYLHSNKFKYFKYPPKEYTGNIINYTNKAKISVSALEENIDLTLNYFCEIKDYLEKTQNNLYYINYDLTENIIMILKFINPLIIILKIKIIN